MLSRRKEYFSITVIESTPGEITNTMASLSMLRDTEAFVPSSFHVIMYFTPYFHLSQLPLIRCSIFDNPFNWILLVALVGVNEKARKERDEGGVKADNAK